MAKTLNQFIEGYLKVKSADEQKFIDKHVTAKNPDRNGNGDDVFKGSTKTIDRRKDRKGYNPGEDEKVYEGYYVMRNGQSISYHQDKESADKHARTANMRGGSNATVVKDDRSVKEELKGSQHKIDANKNGKVDAHDFKLLRGKKKVAEEAEQIDELDTATLKSYRTKARAQGNAIIDKMKMGGGDWSKDQKDTKTLRKRAAGAQASGKQLVKRGESLKTEEVEELDELSKATLGSYVKKAKDQMSRSDQIAGIELGQRHMGAKGPSGRERQHNKRASKRYFGIDKAVDKLTKEEVELEEKLTAKTPMGTYIKDFQKSDAPQFKGKSAKKRQVMAIAAKLTAERGGKRLNKEERLQDRLSDISESHQRVMLEVFEKLNEDNKTKFMTACSTPEGVEQMLDFAITYRGE